MTTLMQNILDTWALTLVHSLWQGLFVLLAVKVALKCLPAAKAGLRYSVTVVSLIFFVLLSAVTFYHLLPDTTSRGIGTSETSFFTSAAFYPGIADIGWTDHVQAVLREHSMLIIAAWLFGATLFLLRLTGSWWYIQRLIQSGVPVTGRWKAKLEELAKKLGVDQSLQLIESNQIDAPFVAGILKPIIFIPVGLVTGMPAQQLEAILIHEIMHVKRHDYLINLFQAFVESLYFFNPFIWMISSLIKTERELCCDDAVVKFGADKKVYAFALASLEEVRQFKNGLVLSAAGNKNQLFNRIKRLMEGSTKNYSIREKLVPVVLLVIGLACASWVSFHRQNAPIDSTLNVTRLGVSADTTIRKKDKVDVRKDKSAKSKSKSTNDSELGQFEPLPPPPHFDIPEPPDFEIMIPEIGEIPAPGFHFYSQDFQEEFLSKFKERFGEFYATNGEELEKMLAELERENWHIDASAFEASARANDDALRAIEEGHRQHEEKMAEFHSNMRDWEEQHRVHMQKFEAQMKQFELDMEVFNNKLREQLIRDGYLGKDEKLENIHLSDDEIEINGKPIRQNDVKKYQEFHEKYFPKMEPLDEK